MTRTTAKARLKWPWSPRRWSIRVSARGVNLDNRLAFLGSATNAIWAGGRGRPSTDRKPWCCLSTATRRPRRNRCRSGPQLQCLANGESSPEGESRRRSDSQAAALSRELVSCGTRPQSPSKHSYNPLRWHSLRGVCGISRDARNYVHTCARLLSELYVVEG